MKKMMKKVAVLISAAVLCMGCSGTSQKQDSQSAAPSASVQTETKGASETTGAGETAGASETAEKDGGKKILRVGQAMAVNTLIPWQVSSSGDCYIVRQIYHTLVEMDGNSNYTPSLATSWECSDDGLEWIFHLRDDVYWQTGNELFHDEKVPVTAEDVKFSFEYYLDPDHQAYYCSVLQDLIDHIEVVDEHTVKFCLKKMDVLFLYRAYKNYIIPQKGVEENWDFNAFPVGSGAYKFKEHVIDEHVTLVKNEDFWQEPGLDEIEYRFITDKAVSSIALQNKEIDVSLSILPTDVSAVAAKDYLTLNNSGIGDPTFLSFNCQYKFFQDPELRKALSMAIDADAAVEAVYKNDTGIALGVRGYSPISPERPGYDAEGCKAVAQPYDPEGAMKKLEELGWTKGSDGIYEKDGEKLSFTLQIGNNSSNTQTMAVVVSTQLKAIGVDCTVQAVEWATHIEDTKHGKTQMTITGGYDGLDAAIRLMHTDNDVYSPNNGYSNPEIDALLDEAWVTVDEEKRADLIKEASRIFMNDSPWMFVWYQYAQTGYNTRVKDFDHSTLYEALCSTERNVTVE